MIIYINMSGLLGNFVWHVASNVFMYSKIILRLERFLSGKEKKSWLGCIREIAFSRNRSSIYTMIICGFFPLAFIIEYVCERERDEIIIMGRWKYSDIAKHYAILRICNGLQALKQQLPTLFQM